MAGQYGIVYKAYLQKDVLTKEVVAVKTLRGTYKVCARELILFKWHAIKLDLALFPPPCLQEFL